MSETIRYDRGDDGIVILTLDDPSRGANTMNDAYVASMEATVSRLEAERDEIAGVIITSAKSSWFAGGDLDQLGSVPADRGQDVFDTSTRVKGQLRRLETLGKPVVAALNGSALGGGLELALATHHRIALNNPKLEVGLPEVTLGLLPAGGGVVRTVRLLGLATALMEVLLKGTRHKVAKARQLGLIDEVVETPEQLITAAKAWIAANPSAAQPWDTKGHRIPGGTPSTRPWPRCCRPSRPTCASSSRARTTRRRRTSCRPRSRARRSMWTPRSSSRRGTSSIWSPARSPRTWSRRSSSTSTRSAGATSARSRRSPRWRCSAPA
ncbi:enoyl-CoA hydratase-related protein [Actinoplanes utahensis]|uniref:enoyl-CoA hydratase-related protein n=1 Tax=Actinoplanes utahensis TaxID=1869 RepID=UPI000AA9E490